MLLNEVVMGKEKLLTITDQALTEVTSFASQILYPSHEHSQAPEGYDSVRGEPGGDLNYDECIG